MYTGRSGGGGCIFTSPMRMTEIPMNSAAMGKVDLGTETVQVGVWEWQSIAWGEAASGKVCGCLRGIGRSCSRKGEVGDAGWGGDGPGCRKPNTNNAGVFDMIYAHRGYNHHHHHH